MRTPTKVAASIEYPRLPQMPRGRRPGRKTKIAIGIGLLQAVLLIFGLTDWWRPPTSSPELRLGMTTSEVTDRLGLPRIGYGTVYKAELITNPDYLGRSTKYTVHFDGQDRASGWETEPFPLTRPPWIDAVLNYVGW